MLVEEEEALVMLHLGLLTSMAVMGAVAKVKMEVEYKGQEEQQIQEVVVEEGLVPMDLVAPAAPA